MELLSEHIKKLKLCIKWFQNVKERNIQELEKLRRSLESAEKGSTETEMAMKNKEEEFSKIIAELNVNNVLLQEKLQKEESMKLDTIDCHKREKDVRDAVEKLQASLTEKLRKVEQEKLDVNSKALQDETVKQRETLINETGILRAELQHIRQDCDQKLLEVHALSVVLVKYKESTGKSVAELDNLTIKSNALEDRCSSQIKQICILQHQLATTNEKLKK